jgi:hypothetical protein
LLTEQAGIWAISGNTGKEGDGKAADGVNAGPDCSQGFTAPGLCQAGPPSQHLKPVYTAVSEVAAMDQFAEFSGTWEKRSPAIIRLWENVLGRPLRLPGHR